MTVQPGPNKYCISRPILGRSTETLITKEDYQRHVQARDLLSRHLEVEQRYDLLVENYLELQASMHSSIVGYAMRMPTAEADFDQFTRPIHRTLFNFLASARAFLDQVRLYTEVSEKPEMSAAISTEYDRRLSFRVMEALRNYAQHLSLPIHSFAFAFEKVKNKDGSVTLVHRIELALKSEELSTNGHFKATILSELQSLGKDEFELSIWLKEYQSSLSSIIARFRRLHEKLFAGSCSLRAIALNDYCVADGNTSEIVAAMELRPNHGGVASQVFLGTRLEDAISVLRNRNRELPAFASFEAHM